MNSNSAPLRLAFLALGLLLPRESAAQVDQTHQPGRAEVVAAVIFVTPRNRDSISRAWLSSDGVRVTLRSEEILSATGCRRQEFAVPAEIRVLGNTGDVLIGALPAEQDLIVELRLPADSVGVNERLAGRGFEFRPEKPVGRRLSAKTVRFTAADSSEAHRCDSLATHQRWLKKELRKALDSLRKPRR